MVATKAVIQVADLMAEQGYIDRRPGYVASVELGGVRTYLMVPILKESELIGAFIIGRRKFALHRQADRTGQELRRPGCHRHREHAAAQRTAPAHY